jgi:two-component system LytT family response regulator
MPGKTGLDVLSEIGPDAMPPTIFVTAYDQYAVRAFEAAAVDYLLKPFDDERFNQAFLRARRRFELEELGRLSGRLRALLDGNAAETTTRVLPAAPLEYADRFAVETRGHVLVVPVEEVDYISAAGPYAELHVGKQKHLLRERMQNLEERLDPHFFLRIHRSTIVRVDRIESLHKAAGGDYSIKLKSGVELDVSRTRIAELEARLGIT